MGKAPKSDPQPADSELLQRHLDGDPNAFEQLIHRYRRELFNFLAQVTAGAFDMNRRLKPWLFTIAANKARDAIRSRKRKQAAPLDAPVGGDGDSRGSFADLLPADIPAPGEALSNQETREAVQKVVEDMPENLRVVLLLSYFHEFPYKEIAEMLGVPLGTVKSRLHAAVRMFAKRWKAIAESHPHE